MLGEAAKEQHFRGVATLGGMFSKNGEQHVT
jgi:hypothetical protein